MQNKENQEGFLGDSFQQSKKRQYGTMMQVIASMAMMGGGLPFMSTQASGIQTANTHLLDEPQDFLDPIANKVLKSKGLDNPSYVAKARSKQEDKKAKRALRAKKEQEKKSNKTDKDLFIEDTFNSSSQGLAVIHNGFITSKYQEGDLCRVSDKITNNRTYPVIDARNTNVDHSTYLVDYIEGTVASEPDKDITKAIEMQLAYEGKILEPHKDYMPFLIDGHIKPKDHPLLANTMAYKKEPTVIDQMTSIVEDVPSVKVFPEGCTEPLELTPNFNQIEFENKFKALLKSTEVNIIEATNTLAKEFKPNDVSFRQLPINTNLVTTSYKVYLICDERNNPSSHVDEGIVQGHLYYIDLATNDINNVNLSEMLTEAFKVCGIARGGFYKLVDLAYNKVVKTTKNNNFNNLQIALETIQQSFKEMLFSLIWNNKRMIDMYNPYTYALKAVCDSVDKTNE